LDDDKDIVSHYSPRPDISFEEEGSHLKTIILVKIPYFGLVKEITSWGLEEKDSCGEATAYIRHRIGSFQKLLVSYNKDEDRDMERIHLRDTVLVASFPVDQTNLDTED
jgi:hypothetical protein